MVRWMCSARPEDRMSAEELKTKRMRESLQDKRLQCFGHLERMEESFPEGRLRNTWNGVSTVRP